MLISLIAISFILVFCVSKKNDDIICLLITLLPFHNFISKLLSILSGSTGLFPIWRDLCCIFLFYKTIIQNGNKNNRTIQKIIILNILYITLILLLFWGSYEKSISYYRIYIDVLLIAYSFSKIKLDKEKWEKILKTYICISFLVCITGFIQYLIIREELHLLFEDYEMRADGGIHFKSPSWLIMGYERMGGFIGGPNSFGIYLSLALYIILTFQQKYKGILSKKENLYLYSCILTYSICLFLSFSRAGWGITILSFYIFLIKTYNSFKIITKTLAIFLSALFIILIGLIIFPEAYEIIEGTFTGEESSVATRGDMVENSYLMLLGTIYGNGLGSTDIESGNFFAESSFLNLTYEIGIQGTLLFYFILICVFITYQKSRNFISIITTSIIIPAIIISIASVNILTWPFIYYLFAFTALGTNKSLKQL